MDRRIPPKDKEGKPSFVARNATDIFNRGDFVTMFWDGRVMKRKNGKFLAPVNSTNRSLDIWSPAGVLLPSNLDSALAAQAMFPPTSAVEMRGDFHENNLGNLKKWEWKKIWNGLIERILAIEEYKVLFQKAYPNVPPNKLSFAHAANALAAFEIEAFTLLDAPFDKYLQGDDDALNVDEKRGALLFYGKANCASCHSGPLMTDQIFHNRIVPQIGPGKGRDIPPAGGLDGTWDAGRGGVTGWTEFYYCFRTPPLRNVEKTGPWMHDGAFKDLIAVVRHELDPKNSAFNYDPSQNLSETYVDACRLEQTKKIASLAKPEEIVPISLNEKEIKELVTFLKALTSPSLDDLVKLIPERVPSGLPVED
jgi:cytochrome c peroxidase